MVHGMTRKLPPPNQRRLDAAIQKDWRLRRRYAGWFEMATTLQNQGVVLDDIAERFSQLGVPISASRLSQWLRKEREHTAA